jgi:putative two-component system response regulator
MERKLGERPTVLVVDDNAQNIELIGALMQAEGYRVLTARDGVEALEQVAQAQPDLILLDIMMPGLDGYAVCQQLKADPATRLIPVVLLTALGDEGHKLKGIEADADDFLSKPISQAELRVRVRSLLKLKRFTDELEDVGDTLKRLAIAVARRDLYTRGHCERVARYAAELSRRIGLTEPEVEGAEKGGFLHDLGKIGIPDAVLLKPGPLNKEEFTIMKEHVIIGEEILQGRSKSFQAAALVVRHHHERYDGSGYPDGLKGEEIPLVAQIVAIVDVYDALATTRPYRTALSHQEAVQLLREEARQGWRNPDLVEAFLAMREKGQLGPAAEATSLPD